MSEDIVLEDLPYDDPRPRVRDRRGAPRCRLLHRPVQPHPGHARRFRRGRLARRHQRQLFVETVRAARQAFGSDSVGPLEPLFVARFATYIREHQAG